MKEIKSYEKISTCERGFKDLVFNGKGWKDSNEKRLTFQSDEECFSICYTEHLILRQLEFCK